MSDSESLSKGNGMRLGKEPATQSKREIGMSDGPEVDSMEDKNCQDMRRYHDIGSVT
jgi:hypothetical protein